MKRAVFAAALACWLALYCAPSTRAQQRPAQRAAKKKDDPFLRGPAFSFDDLLRLVGNVYEGRLKEAIEKKLFSDLKDVVKITTSTKTPDAEQIRKINDVIERLVSEQGYCVVCANALLKYVGTLLSR